MLLIGRDLPYVHRVLEQRTGEPKFPIALRSQLGWTIVGETCLGSHQVNSQINAYKTYVLPNGRPSVFKTCDSKVVVKETMRAENKPDAINRPIYDSIGDDVFVRTQEDDKVGLSIEDKLFLEKMKTDLSKNELGNWEAPLPFKEHRPRLPINGPMGFHRATMFDTNLCRNPIKRDHFIAFMQKLFDNKHAELAPPVKPDEEVWYLPVFGVNHPRKKDQIRGVLTHLPYSTEHL